MLSPELALELRAARPGASPELRERVLEVASREQRRAPRFTLPPLRRVALVAAPAVLALAVGGALVHGLASSGDKSARQTLAPAKGLEGQNTNSGGVRLATPKARAIVPSTPTRLQQYGALMRIQVKNLGALSDTTKRAMRFARLVGGYVAYIRYSSPAHDRGSASLVVRVPI